jgi:hypothetical protein
MYPTGKKLNGNGNGGGNSGNGNSGSNVKPPFMRVRLQGNIDLLRKSGNSGSVNFMRLSCPAAGANKAWSGYVGIKLPRWSGSTVDSSQVFRSPALPPSASCTATVFMYNSGWAPLSVTVTVVY